MRYVATHQRGDDMPAEHFRALMKECRPGVSARQLEQAAGLSENAVYFWLRPSTDVDAIPKTAKCKELARALGCSLDRVAEAFAADAGLPWGPALDDPDERQLVHTFRRLPTEHRHALGLIAQSLAGGPRP